jgi:hypothetical protein
VLVAVIGGKIGSGPHHLLPFIIVNAAYLEIKNPINNKVKNWLVISFFLLAIYFLIGPLPKKISREMALTKQSDRLLNAKEEVINFHKYYKNLLMGVSNEGDVPYNLTYYRVLLESVESQQIDASAFMDTSFVGMSDMPLVTFISDCSLPILMPKEGVPFSALNPYSGAPIFSNALRDAFALSYQKSNSGNFYDVYTCIRSH